MFGYTTPLSELPVEKAEPGAVPVRHQVRCTVATCARRPSGSPSPAPPSGTACLCGPETQVGIIFLATFPFVDPWDKLEGKGARLKTKILDSESKLAKKFLRCH